MTNPLWTATSEPLIYTEIGNIPIRFLERKAWVEGKQSIELKDGKLKITGDLAFIEQYLLDERVVKQNVHVYLPDGLDMGSKLAKL